MCVFPYVLIKEITLRNVHILMYVCTIIYNIDVHVVGSSPTRGSSFFLGKVTALGVLCYFALFVCLTLLASFFLPSHLSFKNMYRYSNNNTYMYTSTFS